jgi:hypothetical protein
VRGEPRRNRLPWIPEEPPGVGAGLCGVQVGLPVQPLLTGWPVSLMQVHAVAVRASVCLLHAACCLLPRRCMPAAASAISDGTCFGALQGMMPSALHPSCFIADHAAPQVAPACHHRPPHQQLARR